MIGYIVEGKNDEAKLKMVSKNNYIVVLNGINFREYEKEKIAKAIKICKKVYVLTDPDEAGNRVAEKIQEVFPSVKRIFVDPDKAKVWKKRGFKYGVEYCSNNYLKGILPN